MDEELLSLIEQAEKNLYIDTVRNVVRSAIVKYGSSLTLESIRVSDDYVEVKFNDFRKRFRFTNSK